MEVKNEQETFWIDTYATEYIRKNSKFNYELCQMGWKNILDKVDGINSYLECGCNIGRNIHALTNIIPEARPSVIEISKLAYEKATSSFKFEHAQNESIINSSLPNGYFDLVFTSGVLIHIAPNELLDNMRKIYSYSRKFIVLAEYFNREPTTIEYQGEKNKLFKRDFGKMFIDNFDVSLVDYGFLWGHIYDASGFDDITYWVFAKN